MPDAHEIKIEATHYLGNRTITLIPACRDTELGYGIKPAVLFELAIVGYDFEGQSSHLAARRFLGLTMVRLDNKPASPRMDLCIRASWWSKTKEKLGEIIGIHRF